VRGHDDVRTLTAESTGSLRELWRYRQLLIGLVTRDLKVKYQRSALGFIWTLLNPLLTVGVLVAVFTFVVRIPIENYWAFLLSGYFAWNYVSFCLSAAASVLHNHSALTHSVPFPNQILVLAVSFSKLFEFLLEAVLVLLVLAVFRHQGIPASWILLPLLIVLQWLMTLGLMYPLAVLAVLFQDVQHALPLALISLFYATPVFYPVEAVPVQFQPLFLLNPLAWLLRCYQSTLYEGRFPEPGLLAGLAVIAGGLFALGSLVYRRYESVCVELA
jgi:lipopolysaccharide transport system permease protein